MEWLPEWWKIVNTFVNSSILDAHKFNIIVNPTDIDIDNIIERVRPAITARSNLLSLLSTMQSLNSP